MASRHTLIPKVVVYSAIASSINKLLVFSLLKAKA